MEDQYYEVTYYNTGMSPAEPKRFDNYGDAKAFWDECKLDSWRSVCAFKLVTVIERY